MFVYLFLVNSITYRHPYQQHIAFSSTYFILEHNTKSKVLFQFYSNKLKLYNSASGLEYGLVKFD